MATSWGNVSCRQRVVEAHYEWTLEYFGSLIKESRKDSCFFWSPAFVFSRRKFRLHLKSTRSFASGKREVWIGLFLVFSDTQPPIDVQYTFGIKTASGDTEVLVSGSDALPSIRNEYPNRCGSYKLIKASELRLRREQLLPLNALTLTISMKISPHTDRGSAEVATQTSADDTGVQEEVQRCQDPEYIESAEAATQTSADDNRVQEAVRGCQDPEYTESAEAATQTGADDTGVQEAVQGCQDLEYTESAEAATQTSADDTGVQEAVQACQDPEYMESAGAATQTSADDTGVHEEVQGCQYLKYTDFTTLGQNIEELEGKDCDISLVVGNKKFLVHKLILEARAPKLAAVISEQEAESETSDVCLKNHNPEVFKVFLRCVYAGAWENLNEKNVCEVYDIADKYDFLELKEACVRHMLSNLSSDSVCSVIDLADKHGEDLLMEKATDFVVANVHLVFKTDAWHKFEANSSLIAYHIYNRVYKIGK